MMLAWANKWQASAVLGALLALSLYGNYKQIGVLEKCKASIGVIEARADAEKDAAESFRVAVNKREEKKDERIKEVFAESRVSFDSRIAAINANSLRRASEGKSSVCTDRVQTVSSDTVLAPAPGQYIDWQDRYEKCAVSYGALYGAWRDGCGVYGCQKNE